MRRHVPEYEGWHSQGIHAPTRNESLSRRAFIRWGVTVAAGAPLAFTPASSLALTAEAGTKATWPRHRPDAKVAIVSCRSYGPEVRAALRQCFDLIGGIGSLVKDKTITVKINLTGTNFTPFLNRPVGETFMTHYATALALASLLFAAGAKRVRFVESTQSKAALEQTLVFADWDVRELAALGTVEFENTRNLGKGERYSHFKVPGGGNLFSSFDLNHAYEETDVMISLTKLKNHVTTGVTLSMKNCFGLTPNSLYGDQAGSEDATGGRSPLHNPRGYDTIKLPGLREDANSTDPFYRVPAIIADICAARPVHLAIIDGITSMSGAEGPWCGQAAELKFITPGVLIAGLNPVSTDAVGTAVMGYADPRAKRGTKPFTNCDNHLLLAEQAGLGTADLSQIDVRGLSIETTRCPYG
jgi:uncharacterized protein (DUF362 family)